MVRVEGLSDDQLTAKMSMLHCMMMSQGGELLACYRRLNQSHREYVLSTDSRLKGYEEIAGLTGLELQSKAKGNERKKKIKSLSKSLDNLHSEFLASDEFSRVQGELLSLATRAGFERGLSMHWTKDEFADVLKKIVNFMPGAQERLAEASPLVDQTDYAFLNKISEYAAAPLSNEKQGTSHVFDDVAEVTVVGSERVSSSLIDVVMALSAGEKGDASAPSSTVEEVVVPPFGV
ncbi:hypothetical protein Tco_0982792 [Tanacetum coccineum]